MTRHVLIFLALLLPSPAFAQPTVTRGGALKKRQYQTYAAMTLYVDSTGSDSGACTSSGTGACATIQGALSKVPSRIRHAVTINVAAGTYTENVRITGLTFDQINGVIGTLTIQSDWTQSAPTTGSVTGTVTSYTAGSGGVPPTWTDSGQGWTVNDLKGRYFRMTSGSFSGQVRAVITANTATTVTMTANMAALSGTYEIVVPAATINGTVEVMNVTGSGSGAAGPVILGPLNITSTSTAGTVQIKSVYGPFSPAFLRQLRVFNTAASGMGVALIDAKATTSSRGNYIETSGANSTALSLARNSRWLDSGGYTRSRGTSGSICGAAYVANSVLSGTTSVSFFPTYEASDGCAQPVVSIVSSVEGRASGVDVGPFVVRGSASNTGINVGVLTATSSYYGSGGIFQLAPGAPPPRIEGASIGFQVGRGGRIELNGSTPTFTGVTNELSLDGTVYPFSFLTGLSSPQVISNSYGSTIIR